MMKAQKTLSQSDNKKKFKSTYSSIIYNPQQPKLVQQQKQQFVQQKVKPQIIEQLDNSVDFNDQEEPEFPLPYDYNKNLNNYPKIERHYAIEKIQKQKIIPKIILSNNVPTDKYGKKMEKDKFIQYNYGYIYYIKDENYDEMNNENNFIGYCIYYNNENEYQILLETKSDYEDIYFINLTDDGDYLLYDSKEYEKDKPYISVGLEYKYDENADEIIILLDTKQKQQQIEKAFKINQSVEKIPNQEERQKIAFGIVDNDIKQQDKIDRPAFLSDIGKAKLKPVKVEQQPKEVVNDDNSVKEQLRKVIEKRRKDGNWDEDDEEESTTWSDEGGFFGGYRRNKNIKYFKNNNQKKFKLRQNDRIKRIKRQHINL